MRFNGYILFGLLALVMLTGCGNFEWFPGKPVITTKTLPDAVIGAPYSQTLSATDGKSPYTWTVSGSLPAGLTLSSSGVLSGTPAPGSTTGTFTVTVTDSANPAGSASQQLTITIPGATTIQMGGAIQGKNPAFTNASTATVSTFAGIAGTPGSNNGAGTAATFNFPIGITTDGTNLYLADSVNNTIRQIVIATGAVTTVAGDATANAGSTDGTGAAATFNTPSGITTDGTNLYVADTANSTIRQIAIATGVVTTIAGNPAVIGGSADGAGAAATFDTPYGITTDGINLYVADTNNSTIRKIVIATKVVTTIAGSVGATGSADGPGSAASFYNPRGITTDGINLYVADTNNSTIRKIVIAGNVVTTVAGSAGNPASADGIGIAAGFNFPCGITTDGTNLYVTDTSNNTIRKITLTTKAVTTTAGTAGTPGITNGTGAAALFDTPSGATTDGISLYVSDEANHTIRRIK